MQYSALLAKNENESKILSDPLGNPSFPTYSEKRRSFPAHCNKEMLMIQIPKRTIRDKCQKRGGKRSNSVRKHL